MNTETVTRNHRDYVGPYEKRLRERDHAAYFVELRRIVPFVAIMRAADDESPRAPDGPQTEICGGPAAR